MTERHTTLEAIPPEPQISDLDLQALDTFDQISLLNQNDHEGLDAAMIQLKHTFKDQSQIPLNDGSFDQEFKIWQQKTQDTYHSPTGEAALRRYQEEIALHNLAAYENYPGDSTDDAAHRLLSKATTLYARARGLTEKSQQEIIDAIKSTHQQYTDKKP